jgi:hypothetical protein
MCPRLYLPKETKHYLDFVSRPLPPPASIEVVPCLHAFLSSFLVYLLLLRAHTFPSKISIRNPTQKNRVIEIILLILIARVQSF